MAKAKTVKVKLAPGVNPLNFGTLPGMPPGSLAYVPKDTVVELPNVDIVQWYIEHKSLVVVDEKTTEIVKDEPAPEATVKDEPEPKPKGKKGGK